MPSLKYSRQREAIKTFLQSRRDHPTAEAVYTGLREQYPNISLGTVYRNLSLLADLGEVSRITAGDGADHYDGRTGRHYHFICNRCHRILDLDMDSADSVMDLAARHFPGQIESYQLNFYGICQQCLEEENERDTLKQ